MAKRIQEIDILKGMAIIAVIILHALPAQTLQILGAPFSLEQALPIFMVLMGFNNTMSFERRRGGTRLSQLYSKSFLFTKLKRIISPSLLVFVIEAALLLTLSRTNQAEHLSQLLGFGGYFIPVALQARLVLPLLYRFLKKTNGWGGIVVLFGVSFAADRLGLYLGEELSQLFIGRYLFAIALGIYLFFNQKKLTLKRLAPFAALSAVYVLLTDYFGLTLLPESVLGSQHTPAYFWTLLLVIAGLRLAKVLKGQQLFSAIGKASYHIFLVQHLYFYLESTFYRNPSELTNILIAVPVCVLTGTLYHKFDKKLVKTRSLLVPRV